jgi:hypothetical protein
MNHPNIARQIKNLRRCDAYFLPLLLILRQKVIAVKTAMRLCLRPTNFLLFA